ncbi:MAG: ABC transporter permease [Spirochaetes bacterium]|nr:ABC transporter permease [Spirochaetota bacterium]
MKILAFIKKDLLIMLSYRFNVFISVLISSLSLVFLYYLSKTFTGTMSQYLKEFDGNYFSFVLVGISVSSFVSVGLHAFANEIRTSQVEGTLEALISTPTSIYTILIGNSMFSFIKSFISSITILIIGGIFFGFFISIYNLLITFLILLLVFISFLAIGMLSASFIMVFKQGNPINFIFGYSSYFMGGIIFPVEVLPKPLQTMSYFLPITHATKALRKLLLSQYDINEIKILIYRLLLFILILLPVSFFAFHVSIKQAKKNGSLVQY